ncbi:MAG: hypothetical protein DRI84_08015, partial [Bacteroidetes bacterium]
SSAFGYKALNAVNFGGGTGFSSAFGYEALLNSTTGSNTAFGYAALKGITTTGGNTAFGGGALSNTTGEKNTAFGSSAGWSLSTGSSNILIGYSAQVPSSTADFQLSIGNLIYGSGLDGQSATISTGNIGIGVKVPTEKLEVDGNIYASGGGVLLTDSSTYADYVFDGYNNNETTLNKDYTFKTLAEVKSFIKLNSHLPGVTGIKELEKTANGYKVNITALSGQLLEKVEELFLHTIAQQDAIEKLTKENNNLKARLAKIEAALGIE